MRAGHVASDELSSCIEAMLLAKSSPSVGRGIFLERAHVVHLPVCAMCHVPSDSVAGARGFSGTGGQELNLMNDIYLIAGVGEDVFDSVLVS